MAKCKACGTDISTDAKACPKCGKPQGMGTTTKVVLVVLAVVLLPCFSCMALGGVLNIKDAMAKKSAEDARQQEATLAENARQEDELKQKQLAESQAAEAKARLPAEADAALKGFARDDAAQTALLWPILRMHPPTGVKEVDEAIKESETLKVLKASLDDAKKQLLAEPTKPVKPTYQLPKNENAPPRKISGTYRGNCDDEGILMKEEGVIIQSGDKNYCVIGVNAAGAVGSYVSALAISKGTTVTLVKGGVTLGKILDGKVRTSEAELYEFIDAEDVRSDQQRYQQEVADSKVAYQSALKEFQAATADYPKKLSDYQKQKVELQASADAAETQFNDALEAFRTKAAKGLAGFAVP